MNFPHIGSGWGNLAVHLSELQFFIRSWGRVSRRNPDQELPDIELSARERREALEREFARRGRRA